MRQKARSSSGQLTSSSAPTRRYRKLACTSQVDETLFGSSKQSECDVKEMKNDTIKAKNLSRSAPAPKAQKNEIIRIITKDLIRDLRIPSEDPSGQSIILSPSEIKRITAKSYVLTKEEKEAALKSKRIAREEAMDAAEERKALIHEADMSRKKNQVLSELEAEAKDRAQYLLERAHVLRMEQEDEVKKVNEMIRGVQCQAIRDTQVVEKKQIDLELQEEEQRLDAMMEGDRRRAIEAEEKLNELRQQQQIQGKLCILEQIEKRLEERLLQDELKQREGQQLLQNMEKVQMEALEAMEKKKAEQRRLQHEILKLNEESLRAKDQRKEEEKMADLQAYEYTRMKLEKQAEYEAEQRRIKKEKELEVARLRALQEKHRDHKAEQDELRARRNQEAAEREWRKKEKEKAKKKLEDEAKLKATRLQQIIHKERMLSIEAGRERAEFERVLRAQQDFIAREKEKEERHHQQLMRHAEGVRQQVREHESQAIARRRLMFREGEMLDEEVRRRRARLDGVKEMKLKELRAAGLPEKYCKEVERKMHILPTLVG